MFDPVYGELINSRKVSELTGFTMNQLRNFRLPERQDKSPFPFIRIGGTSLYRRSDIELWLQQNGGSVQTQYVVFPHHITTPLNNDLSVQGKRNEFAQLGRITTETAWTSMATWAVEQSGMFNATQFIHDRGRQMLAKERGIEDWKTIGTPNMDMKSSDQDAFWKIWVYGVRAVMVKVNQFDLTDEDIMSVPVGDVPPLKTK